MRAQRQSALSRKRRPHAPATNPHTPFSSFLCRPQAPVAFLNAFDAALPAAFRQRHLQPAFSANQTSSPHGWLLYPPLFSGVRAFFLLLFARNGQVSRKGGQESKTRLSTRQTAHRHTQRICCKNKGIHAMSRLSPAGLCRFESNEPQELHHAITVNSRHTSASPLEYTETGLSGQIRHI